MFTFSPSSSWRNKSSFLSLFLSFFILFFLSTPVHAIWGKNGFGWNRTGHYVKSLGKGLLSEMRAILGESGFLQQVEKRKGPVSIGSDDIKNSNDIENKELLISRFHTVEEETYKLSLEGLSTLYPKRTFEMLNKRNNIGLFPISHSLYFRQQDSGAKGVAIHADVHDGRPVVVLMTIQGQYATLFLPDDYSGEYNMSNYPEITEENIESGKIIQHGIGKLTIHFDGTAPSVFGVPRGGTPHGVPADFEGNRVLGLMYLDYKPENVEKTLPDADGRMNALRQMKLLLDDDSSSRHVEPLLNPDNEHFEDYLKYLREHVHPELLKKYQSLTRSDQLDFKSRFDDKHLPHSIKDC